MRSVIIKKNELSFLVIARMSTSHHHHHAAMTCATSLIHGTTFIVRSGSHDLTDPCASLPYDHGILLHSSSQVQTNLIKPSLSLYILEVGIQPRAGCACDLDLGLGSRGRRQEEMISIPAAQSSRFLLNQSDEMDYKITDRGRTSNGILFDSANRRHSSIFACSDTSHAKLRSRP